MTLLTIRYVVLILIIDSLIAFPHTHTPSLYHMGYGL